METTATTKGQVVIPSAVRQKLGIKAGTRFHVEVDEKNGQIILKPITREYIHSLRGMFKGVDLLKDLEASRARDREREDKKIGRVSSPHVPGSPPEHLRAGRRSKGSSKK